MASSQEQGFEKHHYLIVILNIATPSQVALVVKTPPASVGDIRDMVQSLGQGDPLEEDKALQYSCREDPMDSDAWWATVYRVTKSQTRLNHWVHPAQIWVRKLHRIFMTQDAKWADVKSTVSAIVCLFNHELAFSSYLTQN